jgi:CheY-like chemotaxis protein
MENEYLFEEVMLIDDNSMDRLLVANVIKKNSFAEKVTDFSSVATALTYLYSLQRNDGLFPPVIFVDLNMPIMDGFDFLEHYMKFPEELQEQSMIVVISATNSAEDVLRLRDYPVIRMFFRKPFSSEKLASVQKLIATQII